MKFWSMKARKKASTKGAFGKTGADNRYSITRYKKYAEKNMTYREWCFAGGSEKR